MAGQFGPTVYKVLFGTLVVFCLVACLATCKVALKWQTARLRLKHFDQHNDVREEDDDEHEEQQEGDPEDLSLCTIMCTTTLIVGIVLYLCADIHAQRVLILLGVAAIQLGVIVYRIFMPLDNKRLQQLHDTLNFLGLLVLVGISFLTALVALAIYTHAMMTDIAHYDYYGPMRVTGVDAALDRVYLSNEKWFDEMRGQVQLEFGGEWACPGEISDDGDSVLCVSVTWDEYSCNKIVCSYEWEECENDNDDSSAYTNTLQCQQNRYVDALTLVSAGVEYDPSVAPENDSNDWPYVDAFGKCSTCEAVRYPDKWNDANNSRGMAVSFVALGAVLVVASATIYWARRRTIKATDNDIELLPNEHGID